MMEQGHALEAIGSLNRGVGLEYMTLECVVDGLGGSEMLSGSSAGRSTS